MKRALAFLIAFAMLIAACGGGEEEPAAPADDPVPPAVTEAGDTGQPAVTQPAVTIPPPGAPVNPAADDPDMVVDDDPATGEGSNTEFCAFISDVDESQQILDTAFDGPSLREAMEGTIAGMQRARDIAPAEIADDVQFVLDRFLGFVELLEEYEYNILELANAATDPRLSDLDSPEFEAAVNRIGSFCGLDLIGEDADDEVVPVTSVDDAGDLPEALVPPGVVESMDVGGGLMFFSSNAPFADLVAFYTEIFGDPLFSDEGEMAALFQGSYEGTQYSITMGGADGTIEILITPV